MNRHTPGPWQVNHRDHFQVCDADGEVRGCSEVAYCSVGTFAERAANACLIAAAPDLLAALQQIDRLSREYCGDTDMRLILGDIARMAMAKVPA
jgi:hypothetical protein